MKQLTFSVLLAFLFFSSCQKNNSKPSSTVSPAIANNSKLSNFLSITSTAVQKNAYKLLQPEERFMLWSDHLARFANSSELTQEQKAVVIGFINIISPDFFRDGKQRNTVDYAILEYKMKALFPMQTRVLIFSSFKNSVETSNPTIILHKPTSAAAPAATTLPNCSCSTKSDWCGPFSYCEGGIENKCKPTSGGCGTLWASSCDGFCN